MITATDRRYLDVVRRASHADFVFGVTTTHVFCRTDCACRTPREENVEYFVSTADALRAGFRPCRRCQPLGDRSAVMLSEARVTTPLGDMTAVGCEHGLTLLEFTDRPMLRTQRERVRHLFSSEIVEAPFDALDQVQVEVDEYFEGRRRDFTLPLLPLGTPFQRLVWRGLLQVPHGTTTTCDALARQVGRPETPRAVGRANGDNRFAIVIPCHRVIGRDGDLTGYGGGIWRKSALLDLERQADSVDGGHRALVAV